MTAAQVIVVGEALVDLVPREGTLTPLPAGSPVNVAVGLARLGTATAFAGPVSTDGFGRLILERLRTAGVAVDAAARVDAPTTLAVVHLDAERRASYGFYLDGTSAATLTRDTLPELVSGAALHVSFGAIGPLQVPAGGALVELVRTAGSARFVSLDPNVRAVSDVDRPWIVSRLEDVIAACALVKASDEDLAALYPDRDAESVAAGWAELGPALVVVTRGPEGAVGFGPAGRVEVPGERVDVVDTVGAGDAFTAGLLGHLASTGHLDAASLRTIGARELDLALRAAVHVSAVTCTREGADPPTSADLTR